MSNSNEEKQYVAIESIEQLHAQLREYDHETIAETWPDMSTEKQQGFYAGVHASADIILDLLYEAAWETGDMEPMHITEHPDPKCDSCGKPNHPDIEVWGSNGELAEYLGLVTEPIEYETDPSTDEEYPIYDHGFFCEECIEHARRASEIENNCE